MSSAAYACFRCRTILRRVKIDPPRLNMGAWSDVRCAKCRESCNFIGQSLDFPKTADSASWNELRERVQAERLTAGLPPVDVLARTLPPRRPVTAGWPKGRAAKASATKSRRSNPVGRPKSTVRVSAAKAVAKAGVNSTAKKNSRKKSTLKTRATTQRAKTSQRMKTKQRAKPKRAAAKRVTNKRRS